MAVNLEHPAVEAAGKVSPAHLVVEEEAVGHLEHRVAAAAEVVVVVVGHQQNLTWAVEEVVAGVVELRN